MFTKQNELHTLRVIAETLNQSNDIEFMMQTVLEKLLNLTQLQAGWIFLTDRRGSYTLAADHRLPQALAQHDKRPMCQGSCYCLNKYWNGELKDPINIIECKRLDEAVQFSTGDTEGITHHATIPLVAGAERFGVLNVASPGKTHFDDEELTLLQSVAYQIGTAIKRTRLYDAKQQRADYFAKLNDVVRLLWKADDHASLLKTAAQRLREAYRFQSVCTFTNEGGELVLRSREGAPLENAAAQVTESFRRQERIQENQTVSLPLTVKEERLGVLLVRAEQEIKDVDIEVLEAITGHVSLAYEGISVQEKRAEVLLYEERNRLARDLHDSVNQKLFSLSLTARGAKEIARDHEEMKELLTEMQSLSQESMREMRSMIWQLRPVGIEDGLLSALKKYAVHLGINVHFDVEDIPHLSHAAQEALWRISQESMNNIQKHAGSGEAWMKLTSGPDGVQLLVEDHGRGFDPEEKTCRTLGLTSMKERAQLLGGTLQVDSEKGKGTTIHVFIPWVKKEEHNGHTRTISR
ncbi:GAF domain-containing sensor histidine kinase [Halobacillus litoralis]|uniref:GAF domain-containing sensor histidine kinase n=1 Tax=Halobacillus litoralis TaxID=45668 RepID=UPI001CD3A157|nr:GAF domain-containing sensor histidine kinase [Halobacillus litoralis]MCA0971993.1 GAF domain-containing sensor histidine kinase [Halobacillus litoralis]